jgi:light-regulated signal transduction histidine kinase (bacteriophytochrome)
MWAIIVLQGLAMLLQVAAAILALRLMRITRQYIAWILISSSIALIVMRRSVQYVTLLSQFSVPQASATQWVETLLLLIISVLQCLGVWLIAPVFERMRQSETRLREVNAEIEQQVNARTAELTRASEALQASNANLVAANQELERSNADLEAFAYSASHDLQEPLRKITVFSEMLRKRYAQLLPEDGVTDLQKIEGASARMQRLIVDLLTYSRISKRNEPFERVDLNETLRGVLSDLETRLQESGGRVDVAPLPTITADPVQLRQLFQNLVGNALKFHKPDTPPEVVIALLPSEDDPARCRISIRDNGIGFDEKYADRIFGIFQRLHARNEYDGSGIGLALCRRIVQRHGGDIRVQSQPDVGTTFTVSLPLAPQVQVAAAPLHHA